MEPVQKDDMKRVYDSIMESLRTADEYISSHEDLFKALHPELATAVAMLLAIETEKHPELAFLRREVMVVATAAAQWGVWKGLTLSRVPKVFEEAF